MHFEDFNEELPLEILNLEGNIIEELPKGMQNLVNLKSLNLSCNKIEKCKIEIFQLPNLEKLNIVSTIKEVIEDFGPAANGKGIQIEFNSEKETVDYLTDKQYLTRILENLISNALKYSHRDGKGHRASHWSKSVPCGCAWSA